MKKTFWICQFEFKGTTRRAVSDQGITAFKDGFWINKNRGLTKLSDCKYWIPPHKIDYIEKVQKEVVGEIDNGEEDESE